MKNKQDISKRRKKKGVIRSRIIFSLLFLILISGIAVGYFKFAKPVNQTVQVRVRIATSDRVLLDYPITVVGVNPTASAAIEQACVQKNIPYTFKNGFFDGLDNITYTQSEAWLFYKNNELASMGAEQCPIVENDFLELRFENSNMAFGDTPAMTPIPQEDAIALKIKFSSDDKVVLESSISISKEEPFALSAIKTLCEPQSISYTIEEGVLTSFKDISNDDTKKWNFYINGNAIDTALDEEEVADGDVLDFKFELTE